MKTNKHQTLLLAEKLEALRARDLERHLATLPVRLAPICSTLRGKGLLEGWGAGYGLTKRDGIAWTISTAFGCQDVACPLCQGKAGGLHAPPLQPPTAETRDDKIPKKKDLLFVVRHTACLLRPLS